MHSIETENQYSVQTRNVYHTKVEYVATSNTDCASYCTYTSSTNIIRRTDKGKTADRFRKGLLTQNC